MSIDAIGRQRKDLRRHRNLQVEDQPYDTGAVLGDSHRGDVRIIGLDLGHDLAQGRIDIEALKVDHHARRIGHHEVRAL